MKLSLQTQAGFAAVRIDSDCSKIECLHQGPGRALREAWVNRDLTLNQRLVFDQVVGVEGTESVDFTTILRTEVWKSGATYLTGALC